MSSMERACVYNDHGSAERSLEIQNEQRLGFCLQNSLDELETCLPECSHGPVVDLVINMNSGWDLKPF